LIDYCPLWASNKIVFESLNAACRSFSKRFNRSIRTVAHVTNHLMSSGCALRKEPVPNSLDFPSY
jgi:hypothetical protein